MKRLGIVFLFLLLAVPLRCQIKHTREEIVEHYCNAHEVTSGDDFDHFDRVRTQITSVLNLGTRHIHFAVVDSNVINAWDNNLSKTESLICVPVATVRFMGEADGELAFVVAHEIGHAVDETCKSTIGRARVTPPTLAGNLSQLLGGSGRNPIAEQRTCESRADAIGFAIFTKAGYNPYDAAASFGRLEMYSGETSTGILARFAAIGKNHPITPDRISHMRLLLSQQTQP